MKSRDQTWIWKVIHARIYISTMKIETQGMSWLFKLKLKKIILRITIIKKLFNITDFKERGMFTFMSWLSIVKWHNDRESIFFFNKLNKTKRITAFDLRKAYNLIQMITNEKWNFVFWIHLNMTTIIFLNDIFIYSENLNNYEWNIDLFREFE